MKVFALNNGGDGAASERNQRTAEAGPGDDRGGGVTVHDDPGKLIVTWTALAGNAATGYKVQWKSVRSSSGPTLPAKNW